MLRDIHSKPQLSALLSTGGRRDWKQQRLDGTNPDFRPTEANYNHPLRLRVFGSSWCNAADYKIRSSSSGTLWWLQPGTIVSATVICFNSDNVWLKHTWQEAVTQSNTIQSTVMTTIAMVTKLISVLENKYNSEDHVQGVGHYFEKTKGVVFYLEVVYFTIMNGSLYIIPITARILT